MSPSRQHSKNFNRWGNQISSYAFFAFIAFGAGAAAAAFLAPFFAMLITWMERYLKEKTCVTQDNAFLRCNIQYQAQENHGLKLIELHHLCQYECNACPAEIKAKVEPESIGSWISPTSCAMIHRQTYSTATSACTSSKMSNSTRAQDSTARSSPEEKKLDMPSLSIKPRSATCRSFYQYMLITSALALL